MHFVAGLSIKEIVRRTGRDRNTVRRALRSKEPPRYRRAERPSKLEPFREEIHRLLREEGELPGQVIRERLQELGYQGGKTILDDYLREVRPIISPPRTFQRTVYRPGQVCQFDLWEPSNKVPVGAVEHRRAWVVVACLGYSRAGAGALIFSKQTPDLLWGIARCLWQLGGLPGTLVWDRQAGLCAPGGQPTSEFAALCGQLRVGGISVGAVIRRPRAPSSVCRGTWRPTSSPAGGSSTSAITRPSSTNGSRRPTSGRIGRCVAGRSTG